MVYRAVLLSVCALLVPAALVVSGCGGGGGTPVAATVTGTVRDDASLQPVSGAQVSASGATATTNQSGRFTLNTAAGPRTIRITKSGYQELALSRSLQAGANDIGTRYLKPALQTGRGAATGTVLRSGQGVAAARVESGGAQATTRADGSYAIYNLPAGERGLLAVDPTTQRVGYTSVQITAGQAATGVDITLNLQPPHQPGF